MLENDYLMRMIMLFVRFLQQALAERHKDPLTAAGDLEKQIADAVDIDPDLFFSLTPESMTILLELGDFDERLAEFVVRAMAIDKELLTEAGQLQKAELREAQLKALIATYHLEISNEDLDRTAIEAFLQDQADESAGDVEGK